MKFIIVILIIRAAIKLADKRPARKETRIEITPERPAIKDPAAYQLRW